MSISLVIPIFLGWLAGLTVNYLSDVLPVTRSFSKPACPQCGAGFAWTDYFLLRSCPNGHARSIRTWIVQLIITAMSVYTWLEPPKEIGYYLGLILIVYFGIVFTIDMEHRLILHPTSMVGSLLALIVGYIRHGLLPTLIGGLSGLLIILVLYFFGMLFAKYRAKRMLATGQEPDDEEALGFGDVILVTILGLMLGWPVIGLGLMIGILLGGFFSLLFIARMVAARNYEKNSLMLFLPYGPYLITSAFLIIYFPEVIKKFIPG